MSMRIGLLALLACLLVLPASAHASSLRVTVVIHGPGMVTGNNFPDCVSTAGNAGSKVCGTITVGVADENSSTYAAFTATANATQPNKSTFVKWTCITSSNAGCGGCAASITCQMTSALEKGVEDVIASVEFSDTTAPNAPTAVAGAREPRAHAVDGAVHDLPGRTHVRRPAHTFARWWPVRRARQHDEHRPLLARPSPTAALERVRFPAWPESRSSARSTRPRSALAAQATRARCRSGR